MATDLVQWADGPLGSHPDVCSPRGVFEAPIKINRLHEALVQRLDVQQQRRHPQLLEQEVVCRHVVVIGSTARALLVGLKLAEELREGNSDGKLIAVADIVGVKCPPHLDADRVAAIPGRRRTMEVSLDSFCPLLVCQQPGLPPAAVRDAASSGERDRDR